MGARDQMRAADADREGYAQWLREAVGDGRLTLEEMDSRVQQVYGAKTFGDLDRIVADLPGTTAPQHSQVAPAPPPRSPAAGPAKPVPPSRPEENPRMPRWLAFLWRLWVVAVLVNVVIWFAVVVSTGNLAGFWPIWVAGPWGAVMVGLMILFPPRRRSD